MKQKEVTFFEAISITGLGDIHPNGIQATNELLKYAGLKDEDHVLDIGCGTGKTSCHISKKMGCKVVGTDISSDMIFMANKRAASTKLEKKVNFITADLQNLPFENDSFDAIILESVMIYVNKEKALNELKRVLKPDGKICANEFTWLQKPNISLVNKTSEILNASVEILTIDEWKSLFQSNGMVPVVLKTYDFKMSSLYQIRKLFSQGVTAFQILYKALNNPKILKKILEIKKHFSKNSDFFGYSLIIARKDKI